MRNITMILLSLVLSVIFCFSQASAKWQMPKVDDSYSEVEYVVQKGDSLWKITGKQYFGKTTMTKCKMIASWNNNQIKQPNYIVKVGQKLRLRQSFEETKKVVKRDKPKKVVTKSIPVPENLESVTKQVQKTVAEKAKKIRETSGIEVEEQPVFEEVVKQEEIPVNLQELPAATTTSTPIKVIKKSDSENASLSRKLTLAFNAFREVSREHNLIEPVPDYDVNDPNWPEEEKTFKDGFILPLENHVVTEVRKAKALPFNDQQVLVAVYNRSNVQTLIQEATVAKNLECRASDFVINDFHDLRVTHCSKSSVVYLQLYERVFSASGPANRLQRKLKHLVPFYKPQQVSGPPPGVPMMLEPPVFYDPETQRYVNRIYAHGLSEVKFHSDLAVGEFIQWYNNGTNDISHWINGRVFAEFYKTAYGTHSIGVGYNGSTWKGDYTDPDDIDQSTYDFKGYLNNPNLQYVFTGKNSHEWSVSLGYLTREDEGHKADPWGVYDTHSWYRGRTYGLGFVDTSRQGEKLFSKIQLGLDVTSINSSRREATFVDNSGIVINTGEAPENINGVAAKVNLDIYKAFDGMLMWHGDFWAQTTSGGIDTGKAVIKVGLFKDSLQFGWEFTAANIRGESVFGNGPALMIDGVGFYEYADNEWINPVEAKEVLTLKSKLESRFPTKGRSGSVKKQINPADYSHLEPKERIEAIQKAMGILRTAETEKQKSSTKKMSVKEKLEERFPKK